MNGLKDTTNAFIPWFLGFLLLFQGITIKAQVNLGPDTTVCANSTVTLNINSAGLVGTPISLSDDRHSGIIPIGFPFTYFGTTYNNLVIASNDYVTFNTSLANTTSPWNITAGIPSPTLPTNSIMAPYQDVNPNNGGSISYITIGQAPNRIFIVTFFEVPMFSCSSLCFTNQIKLYETTNVIEIHIGNKPLCSTWNSGVAIEGIQNATGTVAYVVPGRNYPVQWTAMNDGYRFTPTGPATYNMASTAYNPTTVLSPGNGVTINWYQGSTLVSSGTATTYNATPSTNTTYTGEIVYDCSGLMFSDDINITVTQPNVSVTPVNSTICASQSVNLTASGASSYGWSPAATLNTSTGANVTASPTSTTTYTVTGIDNMGCSATATSTITVTPGFTANISSQTSVGCNGGNDGTATASATGGTTPYTYQWSNGQNGTTATNLSAGTYTVTITDGTGCFAPLTVTITEPNTLSSTLVASTFTGGYNVSCNGALTGSLDLTPTGGTYPFNYIWSTGSTTEDINGLAAGSYTVTITDAGGCTTTNTATLNEPPAITATFAITDANCNGNNDGAIDMTVSGGLSPYTYSWSTGATTEDISNLSAGTYGVTITDANGCTNNFTQAVTEPSGLAATAVASTLPGGTSISCNGANDGSIDLTVTGGTQPYIYNWSNGANTEDLNNLSAGSYTVSVTSNNGCIVTANAIISEPAAINATLTPQVYVGGNNISCGGYNDGSIDLTVTGGVTPFTYTWSNGYYTEDISSLTAGNYTVSITDANGCTTMESTTLTEPAGMTSTITSPALGGGYNISCANGNDGSIDLTILGGAAPYTYEWSNYASTEDLANISAGSYQVTVTDGNNCVLNDSITLTEPLVLVTTTVISNYPSGTNISCYGSADGSIDLTVTDGTPPYSYNWNTNTVNEDLNNIPAGIYTVTITDANGCTKIESDTLTEPAEFQVTLTSPTFPSGDNISCNGFNDGEIDLTAYGGNTPFTFAWSNGASQEDLTGLMAGNYTVTITDANGCVLTETITLTEPVPFTASITSTTNANCAGGADGSATVTASGGANGYVYNWNNGQSSPIAVDLSVGTYTVTVNDANGCLKSDSATIVSPSTLSATITDSTNISCYKANDGEATVLATGGTTPYSYLWNDGQTTPTATNLSAGLQSVTVTDNQGCTASASVTLTQPDSLTLSQVNIPTICIGSNATLSATVAGGTPAYTYNWAAYPSDPSLNASQANPTVSPTVSTDYTLTLTDVNGCMAVFPAISVPVNLPLNIAANAVGPAGICPGDSTIIAYSATGGDGDYHFSSNLPSNPALASEITVTPPSTTTYNITVTDGCGTPPASTSIDIEVFALPVPSFTSDPMEGCIPLEVNFINTSTNAVSYQWHLKDFTGANVTSSNSVNPIHTFTEDGDYYTQLIATSAEGCKDTLTSSSPIIVHPLPDVDFEYTPKTTDLLNAWVEFEDQTDDAVNWYWNFGDGESSTEQHPEHLYTDTGEFYVWLTTVSQYGCIDSAEAIVKVTPNIFVYIPNAFTPNGDGLNDEFMASTYGMDNLEFTMRIFSRSGEQLFFTRQQHVGWDGTFKGNIVPAGVYVYSIDYGNGDQKFQHFSGKFNLVR